MSIISSNHRLVKVNGIEYSAGSGIDITDKIISVDQNLSAVIDDKLDVSSFSSYSATIDEELQYVSANAGNTYSAGDNIDIYEQDNDLYISAKDWTTDIANASSYAFNEATAQIPPEFDPTYMSGQIDNKLNKSDFDTYSGSVNTQISGLSGEFQTTSSLLDNKITAVRNDLNTVSTNTGYLYNDIQTTSGILSGAIDYVSSNLPEPFTGVNHDDNFSGDGKSTPLGIALHSTIAGNDIYGGPTIKLSGSDKEIMNIGSTQISLWHPASGVGGGAVYSYINGDGLDLTYNAGSYYLRTLKTTNSGLMIYNRGAIASSYLDGKGLYVWDGENVESAGLNDIQKWNSVYNDVTTASGGWGGGDVEVNEYVYNNSATINDVDTSYIQNSGTFLTAHQDLSNYVTTGDLNNASGILSGAIDYVSGAAITAHQDLSYISGQVDNKLDTTAFSTVSGTFLTAHQDISNKLDTTAFSTVSGTFLTAVDLSNYYTKSETSGATELADAFANIPAGDADVNAYVQNNSATINDVNSTVQTNSSTWDNGGFTGEVYGISGVSPNVEVYIDQQTLWISAAGGGGTTYTGDAQGALDEVYANSGIWLTAHQDISNKLDTTAFSTVSGTFLTAHQPISANEWNSVYDTVESNSGSWTGGGGGSIDTIPVAVISPLVTGFSGESAYLGIESTALNLSSYVPVSAIGVNSNGYVSGISGMYISAKNAYTAYTANYAQYASRANYDGNYNTITSYYQPKLTIAGSAGTITAINGSAVGASIPEGWELVAGAGISIVDDAENNQTIISSVGSDLSNYYTKTETSSKIELDNAIGNIETLLANL